MQLPTSFSSLAFASSTVPNLDPSSYIKYELTWEQFFQVQPLISSADFGETIEQSIAFFQERSSRLNQEAEANEETYGYGLYNQYCSYGFSTETEGGVLTLWYQTTSGTILVHRSSNEFNKFIVYLPVGRKLGYHNSHLDAIVAGRTAEQCSRWEHLHSGFFTPEVYSEFSQFHNKNLAPLGYEPVMTLEERLKEREDRSSRRREYEEVEEYDEIEEYGEIEEYEEYEE